MTGLSASDFSFTNASTVTASTVTEVGNGVYTVTFTSTTADPSYTVMASYMGVTIGAAPVALPIPFKAGTPHDGPMPDCSDGRPGTHMSVAPSSLTVGDNATATALVTDANCNPIAGVAVDFAQDKHAVISTTGAGSFTTNADGIATANVTDEWAETVSVSGTYSPFTAPNTGTVGSANVTFNAGGPKDGPFDCGARAGTGLSVSPTTAQINTNVVATAHVTDEYCNPLPNINVSFTTSSSTASVAPTAVGSYTTDINGNATANVTDTEPGTVTVSGTYAPFTAPNVGTVGSADVLFKDSAISGAKSSFTVSPVTDPADTAKTNWPVANGTDYYTGTITVHNGSDEPVSGLTTSDFTFTASSYVTVSAVTELSSGTYQVYFSSKVADASYTVSVAVQSKPIGAPDVRPIPFKAGAPKDGPFTCTDPIARPGTGMSADPTSLEVGSASTATALVTDANCNPIEGATVTFSATNHATVAPTSGTTLANGQTSTAVNDHTAETTTVSGAWSFDGSNGTVGSVGIEFTAGSPWTDEGTSECAAGAEFTNLSVAATEVPINTSTNVRAYVTDKYCNPLDDVPVTFANSPAAPATLTPSTKATTAGEAIVSLTDSAPETVTVSATIMVSGAPSALPGKPADPVQVTFTDSAFSAANSSFVVAPIVTTADNSNWPVADGVQHYTGTITMRDGSNRPMDGLSASDFTFGNVSAVTASTVTALGNGQYQVLFTSTTAASIYTVLARYQGTAIGAMPTALPIPFKAGTPHDGPMPDCSDGRHGTNISVMPDSLTVGENSIATALVTDANCNPIPGLAVDFSQDGHAVITPTATGSFTTNAVGIATANVTDTWAETVAVSGTYSPFSAPQTGTIGSANVTFNAGAPQDGPWDCGARPGTNFTASPTNLQVNLESTLTAYVTDVYCNPLDGIDVTFATTQSSTFTTASVVTTVAGYAQAKITDTVAETVTASASDGPIGSMQVTFTAGSMSPSDSVFTVTPVATSDKTTWVTADGTSQYTGTVAAKDSNGNPVSGLTVTDFTFVPSSADVTVSSVTESPAGSGNYVATFTSKVADATVTVHAEYMGNIIGAGSGTVLPIPFKAGDPSLNPTCPPGKVGTNFSVDSTVLPLNGSSTGTAYVTDEYCNPVEGATVTFASSVTGATVSPATMDTGADGYATATITSATPITANFSATITIGELPGSPVAVTWYPGAPSITGPAGPVVTDQPEISGTGSTPGNTVTVWDENNNELCTATIQADLSWSCTPSGTTKLSDGDHSVVAVERDTHGYPSVPSVPLEFTVDTTPPAITAPAAGSTVVTPTPVISGDAPDGSTVTVYDSVTGDPVPGCVDITVSGGKWSCTPTGSGLSDGDHNLTPKVSDGNGGTNTGSPVAVTVDTTEPTIDSPTAGSTVATGDPTLSGSAPADTFVTVKDSVTGQPVPGCEDVAVDASGHWTCKPTSPLSDGTHMLTPIVTDGNGGTNAGTPIALEVNTTAPVITGPTDGATVLTGEPEITGTGNTPGDTITVRDKNGDTVCTATVQADLSWSCTPSSTQALSDGDNELTATETDVLGDEGTPSSPIALQVNTNPPAITVPGAGMTVVTDTPIISGTGQVPGDTITVTDENGNTVCTAVVHADKTWTCMPGTALGDGSHTLTAVEQDSDGNTGTPSTPIPFTVDTTPPTISVPGDGMTVVTDQPIISGTGTAEGDTITVTDGNGNVVCTATVKHDKTWSCTPSSPLAPGDNTLTATETDQGGNTGDPSTTITINVDTTPPSITGPADGDLTNNDTPTISGTGTAEGDTVTVTDGHGNVLCTATVRADKTWSCTPNRPLPDGPQTIIATETDQGGNTGTPSDPIVVTIDTSVPSTPVVDPSNGTQITGTGDPGDDITITDPATGDPIPGCENVVVDASGHFKCTPTTPLQPGDVVEVVATNPAGTDSRPVQLTIGALGIKFAYDNPIIGQTQVVTGTNFNPGDTVELTIDGVTIGTAVVGANGQVQFTFPITSNMAVGLHEATLTGTTSGSVSGEFTVKAAIANTGGSVVMSSAITSGAFGACILAGLSIGIIAIRRRKQYGVEES